MYDRLILIAAVMSVAGAAHAVVPCYSNSVLRDFEATSDYIHKAAVYGDKDKRQTEDEYAAAKGIDPDVLKSKTAATGLLNCNGYFGTAQVTDSSNVITTAGHLFEDINDCKHHAKPTECTFAVRRNGTMETYKVSEEVARGFHCPEKAAIDKDWAVLKLDRPVVGVTPYLIPDANKRDIVRDQSVIAIGAFSGDFYRIDPKTNKKTYPKHMQTCDTQKIYGLAKTILFSADCDGGQGTSGGSILSFDLENPTLLGIISSNLETDKEIQHAERTGKPTMKPFNEKTWASFNVPVNGAFLDAIKSARH